MAHDVFISHSSKDKTLADAVCAALERDSIRCWIAPRDVMPGADWGAAIAEAIKDSKVILLIFTANANESHQIKREVECAVSHEVTIVPLRLERIQPTESFEFFLGNIHWLDALTPPLEANLRGIADKLKAILSRPSTTPVPLVMPNESPTHEERPNKSSLPLILGLVALLVLLGAAFAFWSLHKKPPAITQEQVAPKVDPGLVGTWEYRTQVLGRDYRVRYHIEASGDYQRVQFFDDRGTFTTSDGKWQAKVSATGRIDEGTYEMSDADTLNSSMTILGVPLTTIYTRTKRGLASHSPLEGSWHASNVLLGGCPWECIFELFPDQTYHSRMEANDSGIFEAANGTWHSTSHWQWAPGLPGGTYKIKSADKIEMSVPPLVASGELDRVTN